MPANFFRQRCSDCSETSCLRAAATTEVASAARSAATICSSLNLVPLHLGSPQVKENLTYLWSNVRGALQRACSTIQLTSDDHRTRKTTSVAEGIRLFHVRTEWITSPI
jgi:hypothetical protein